MPDIIHQASDDQIALAICLGAVVISGLVMHFSFHVGRLTGRIRLHETADPTGISLPAPAPAFEAAVHDRAA